MSFDKKLQEAVQGQIISSIHKADLLQLRYDERFKLPESFMQDCWSLIDKEELKSKLAKRLESELIDRLVNHMAQEIATDIKQILSVKERREAVRSVVRDNFDSLTKI